MVPGLDAVTDPVHPTPRRGLVTALAIALLLGTVSCGEPVDQLVAQAAAMREAGDLRGAASTLDPVLVKQPKNITARLLAAQIYIDLERGDAALGLLMRARDDGIDQRQIVKSGCKPNFSPSATKRFSMTPPTWPRICPARSGQASLPIGVERWQPSAKPLPPSANSRTAAADPHSVEVRVIAGRLAMIGTISTERVSCLPGPCARPRTIED